MPGAHQEIRGPSEITHGIKVGVSSETEGLDRAGSVTGFGAFNPKAEVVVLHKYLPPSYDMDPLGAYLNAFSTGDTVIGPAETIFSYGVSESGRSSPCLG